MKITHDLAQQIVDRTISIIGKNINIMDENGFIIGTGEKSRLNKYHEGAALVIKNKEKMFIYPENKENLIGVKPGVNLPIEDNNQLIGVVGITGNPDEVGPFGEIIKMTVEMMLQQEFLLKEIALESQAKENFIHDLISGRIGNNNDLFIERGEIVGYDITLPRVAIVVNINRFEKTAQNSLRKYSGLKEGEIYLQRIKNDVLRIIRDFFISQPQDIVSYIGGDRFLVLKTINLQDNPEKTRKKSIITSEKIKNAILTQRNFQSSIGIGEYHPGIKGIMRSYQEACRALEIWSKMNNKTGINHIANLGISRLLIEISPETRNDFLNYVYKDKDSLKKIKPVLWETLQSFFKNNLNITKTSKEIYVHRNTLLYRLDRIRHFTGLDPRNFNDALQLYIAFKITKFNND